MIRISTVSPGPSVPVTERDGGGVLGLHAGPVRFPMRRSLTVLLCDDQPVVLGGLRTLLRAENDITVVGEFSSGQELLREVVVHRPDVLVFDPHMPGLLGAGTIRTLCRLAPDVALLVFTVVADDRAVRAVLGAGAGGYVLKSAQDNDIVTAVRGVVRGGVVFCPRIGRRLLERFSGVSAAPFPRLTTREREVLSLMAGGISNTAIAQRLTVSTKTVSNHISSIFAKLGLVSRAEAIVAAREAGLGVAR